MRTEKARLWRALSAGGRAQAGYVIRSLKSPFGPVPRHTPAGRKTGFRDDAAGSMPSPLGQTTRGEGGAGAKPEKKGGVARTRRGEVRQEAPLSHREMGARS